MNKKYRIWMLVALVLLAAFFVKLLLFKSNAGSDFKKNLKKEKKVLAYVIQPVELADELTVSGTLIPFEQVELRNEIGGRIVLLNLPEGKLVKQGTLLVKLFDDDLQAVLKRLQSQFNIQNEIHNRQKELIKVNGISQNDFDQSALQLKILLADIAAQKALIRKTEVRAPFDGLIGLRNVSIGAIVSSGTILANIRSENKLKLDFSVPEKYSAYVNNSTKINFTVNGENKLYKASVFATEKQIEVSSRNLRVRAFVDRSDSKLIPGAFANVFLKFNERKSTIQIPSSAVIPQQKSKLVVVARNGLAKKVKITTGVRLSGNVEVTSGLSLGDTVIVTGAEFLKENTRIQYSNLTTEL